MWARRLIQAVILSAVLVIVLPGGPAPGGAVASASPGADEDGESEIRINEVMFHPDTGQHEWVELTNAGSGGVDISGYGITDEDDNWYRIPDALPEVPAGGFVVIVFDGAESSGDDIDFTDDVATLHSESGLVDIFEDDADQCALYTYVVSEYASVYLPYVLQEYASWNPPVPGGVVTLPTSPLVAFVAWGVDPGDDASEADVTGVWSQDWHVNLHRGSGVRSSDSLSGPGESIGLLPGSETAYPDDWTLYQPGEVTQGGENIVPSIAWHYPTSGATVDSETFSVGWSLVSRATGYRFQMDEDDDFSSPVVDTTLMEPVYIPTSPVAEGTYYWRVKVIFEGGESSWSSPAEIKSATLPSMTASDQNAIQDSHKVLGIAWQVQGKDTNMLCLDGDEEDDTNSIPWDAPHTRRSDHGDSNCVRASISMMASYYGGALSQDRISYEIFKGGPPEGDLGHGVGVDMSKLGPTLAWALDVPTSTVPLQTGKPTFDQIKGWITAERPIMARTTVPDHVFVIDGFSETVEVTASGTITKQFIHRLDPWAAGDAGRVSYADDDITEFWVGPAKPTGAPGVKSDEDEDRDGVPDTMQDSDEDGVCDFDERYRFSSNGRSLDPNYYDSDCDLVPDQEDMLGYVFGNEFELLAVHPPDIDCDGHRKELDPDNDRPKDDGLIDGCEDSNQNGKWESDSGELDNFDPNDDIGIHARLSWSKVGADVDLHLIRPGGSIDASSDCYFDNRNPDWGMVGIDCDDPTLDVDCIVGCTVENIRLGKLENGTYSIKVHYYWDHDLGPVSPRVTLVVVDPDPFAFGEPQRFSFPSQQLELEDKEVWHVATVEWPSGKVTPIGTVSSTR